MELMVTFVELFLPLKQAPSSGSGSRGPEPYPRKGGHEEGETRGGRKTSVMRDQRPSGSLIPTFRGINHNSFVSGIKNDQASVHFVCTMHGKSKRHTTYPSSPAHATSKTLGGNDANWEALSFLMLNNSLSSVWVEKLKKET